MRPSDDKVDVDVNGPGTGSESAETWRPTDAAVEPIRRDETGEGRRSP
jgi:hypothetical protein